MTRLETKDFIQLVGEKIYEELSEGTDYDRDGATFDKSQIEVIPVWLCKTIQNHKGMFIVKYIDTFYSAISPYFIEATYNGDEGELYLDFYRKDFKKTINLNTNEERVE